MISPVGAVGTLKLRIFAAGEPLKRVEPFFILVALRASITFEPLLWKNELMDN